MNTNGKLGLMMLSTMVACGGVSVPQCDASVGHPSLPFARKMPARKEQPRNKPCSCGSGKKAKRCCVFVADSETE